MTTLTSGTSITELKERIIAFRTPVFGESAIEKQRIILNKYPGIFPFKPILDVAFSNYVINGKMTSESWDDVVRYSIKLPRNQTKIIQPRVKKCHYNGPGKVCFIIQKTLIKRGQMTNFFFDPIYCIAPFPIFFEYNFIDGNNNKQLIMQQMKYCLNNLQKRSLLMVSEKYPTTLYDLKKLNYNITDYFGYYKNLNADASMEVVEEEEEEAAAANKTLDNNNENQLIKLFE